MASQQWKIDLFNAMKPIVWMIRIREEARETYCTGFSVRDGYIISSCKDFNTINETRKFDARRNSDKKFVAKLEVFHTKTSWGLCLFRIVNNVGAMSFGDLATNGSISREEELPCISHWGLMDFSIKTGRATQDCTNQENHVVIPNGGGVEHTCARVLFNPHRDPFGTDTVMCEAFNCSNVGLGDSFSDNLAAYIRIVICNDLGLLDGCSGSPVFTKDRKIIGVLLVGIGNSGIVVHHSVVRKFLEEVFQKEG